MKFKKAFLINNSEIVAANDIITAKVWWMSKNPLVPGESIKISECNLDTDGVLVEVSGEIEAIELLKLMMPGDKTYFYKTDNGLLLVWIKLREALKNSDSPEPFVISVVR